MLTQVWVLHPNIPSPAVLATAQGAGAHSPRAEYAATLSRHTGVVNAVRFSPSGEVLASTGDDGTVLFWVRSDPSRGTFGDSTFGAEPESQYEKEAWRVQHLTRATSQELYDIAWSPDGAYVVVGGTDFVARIINAADGSVIREISDHQHYVQGVAWDPLNQFLATQSSDRAVHLYHLLRSKGTSITNIKLASRQARLECQGEAEVVKPPSATKPREDDGDPPQEPTRTSVPALPPIRPPTTPQGLGAPVPTNGTSQKLYGDDRYSSFFRRLAFSPDGALLATPTAQYAAAHHAADQRAAHTTSAVYLYGRGNFSRAHAPIAALPGHKSVTLVVEFSPILYCLREKNAVSAPAPTLALDPGKVHDAPIGSTPVYSAFGLPYRMIYAVATQESVWVYDTQQAAPLCCFSNLHYASFTDLSWSPDGQVLLMSSSDGYCSVAVFDYNELGRPFHYASQPSLHRTPALESEPIPPLDASTPATSTLKTPDDASTIPPASVTDPTPPAVPAAPSTSETPRPKKRRVALTFEGPIAP